MRTQSFIHKRFKTYKRMLAALAVTLFAPLARAQDKPAADVAVGYSLIQQVNGSGITANGGSGSVAFNFNNWLGAIGDFGLYHASALGPGLDGGTYTFGPRFSYRHWGKVTPFAEVLVGGARSGNNWFVYGAGGGADIGLDRGGRFTLRQEVEYLGFHMNGNTTQTVRVSIGVAIRFWKRS
jgi:hypothetical protein